MIFRRDFIGSRCRQCGHTFAEIIAKCPDCGFRTGQPNPVHEQLRDPLRHRFGPLDVESSLSGVGTRDADEIDPDTVTLAPAVERPPDDTTHRLLPMPKYRWRRSQRTPHPLDSAYADAAHPLDEDEPAHAVNGRSYSLETLLAAITVISICLAICRVAPLIGVPLLIVCIPAFVRAWRATILYQTRLIGCARGDIVGIFVQSLIYSIMSLSVGGLAWIAINFISTGLMGVPAVIAATFATVMALALMIWMVLEIWPIECD